MRKPAARSSSSCSMASTSSMRASESAERSSAKLASRVMRLSSISRMSASRSRMIRNTSPAWTGPGDTPEPPAGRAGVSDTMVGDRLLHAMHDARLGALGGHSDGGVDVAGIAGTVRDHTHAVDAEQDGTPESIRIVLGDVRAENRLEHLADPGVADREVQGLGREPQDRPHTALDGLEGDVAGEAVGDDDVGPAEGEVTPLDVADEPGQLREQVVGALAHLVALAHLLADRQERDPGPIDAVVEAGVLGPHAGELDQ